MERSATENGRGPYGGAREEGSRRQRWDAARHRSTEAETAAPGRTRGGARLRDVRPGTGAASPALADGRGGRPKRLTGDPVSEAEGGEELNGSGAWDVTG
jgi:hypothetical protein